MKNLVSIFKINLHKASQQRKLYVFLFCLVLSTFFWLLNALGNNYKTTVEFDVIYSDLPKDRVIINKLPTSVKMNIKGLGYDLMSYKFKLFKPQLDMDLSFLEKESLMDKTILSKVVSTSTFKSKILFQLGEKIELENIYPDSILFLVDEKIDKLVKIVPQTKITYKKQYQLDGSIKVIPPAVRVTGAKLYLDTLKQVYTDQFEYEELSESLTGNVRFDPSYALKGILLEQNIVSLHIPVEKYTESSTRVMLEYLNVPDSLSIKAIPNEVEVKYMLPLNKIANKRNSEMRAYIDFRDIDDNFSTKLKVNLSQYPDYISAIDIKPVKVEYILKRKK